MQGSFAICGMEHDRQQMINKTLITTA